jgi:hypothetical protein
VKESKAEITATVKRITKETPAVVMRNLKKIFILILLDVDG